ncbi:MAG: ATP-binding protein [Cyanobacteria bacterium J06632_3]
MANNPFLKFSRPALPLQISIPFVVIFLCGWVMGGTIIGRRFSEQMEHSQQQQAEDLVSLMNRELERELYSLRRQARLIARDESVSRGVETSSLSVLQREALPLSSILGTDFITVFDQDRLTLLDTRQLAFQEIEFNYGSVTDLTLAGADISTFISTNKQAVPFVVGTAPVKNEQGVVGGIVIGTALSSDLLAQINESIQEQIIVVADGKVVASTLASEVEIDWQGGNDSYWTMTIDGESFLAESIPLEGLNGDTFELVLLTSRAPLIKAQQDLWVFIVVLASAGAVLTAVLGHWVALRVARPIQSITEMTLKVVEDSNFELQIPVRAQDEIGVLSGSVNQLIQWVGEYTDELEQSAQLLETRVEQRTQALSAALAELKETQSQLVQTEKMSSLGQMVAGIAHEINNPISFIQGNIAPLKNYFGDLLELLEVYQQTYPEPADAITELQEDMELEFLLEDVKKLLASMKMGTQRVRDIVVSLRNFSRLDEATIKDVDLSEGLDSTLLILNHRIKQGVTVVKNYAPLPLVMCSPAQLNQVFTNIIANALDAMFDADSSTKELVISTCVCGDKRVQVSIKDTGPGMTEAVKAKIFDPFFTTKPVGKGTGIGLGICFKIIDQHQGTIAVNSELGNGTEFLITLPISPDFDPSGESAFFEVASNDAFPSQSEDRPTLQSASA